MKKLVILLSILFFFPFISATGDNWLLHFSDGTLKLNGTDVCLDDGTCMSTIIAGGAGDITSVTTEGKYLTGGADSGIVNLLVNETELNNTITLIATSLASGDNESWNETYANTLYLGVGDESNLNVNSSDYWDNLGDFNSTQMENDGGSLSILESWLSALFDTFFGTKDTDDLTEGSTNLYDNQTWNETLADSKYALIGAGADNESWNETLANTLYAPISTVSDNSSWNESLADTLYAPINYGDDWNKTYADTLYADIGVTGDNSSWNQSLADTLYADISITGGNESFNQTLTDTLYAPISITGDNSSWNQSLADTLYADISITGDNSSWNESYADTKYLTNSTMNKTVAWDDLVNVPAGFADGIDNQSEGGADWTEITSIPEGFDDDIDNDTQYTAGSNLTLDGTEFSLDTSSVKDWLDTLYAAIGSVFSGSWNDLTDVPAGFADGIDNDTTYSDLSEFNNDVGYFDEESDLTSLLDDNYADIGVTGDNSSWNESLADTLYAPINYGDDWNKTYADTLYADISVVTDNASWSEERANELYAPISVTGDNSSWNETLADEKYYTYDNPSGFYNSSDFDIADYYTSALIDDFAYYNASTFDYNDYLLISDWNATNDSYYLVTNPANYWNDTHATFNKTYADTLYADISVTGDNSSWNETLADTLYAPISTVSDNSSWNESLADTLYADISVTGDNSSWNESLADTLYADISVVDTNVLTDADFNATQMEDNEGTLNILESWLSTLFDTLFGAKDTDDLTEGSTNLYDNQSWNETRAGELFPSLSTILGFGYYNSSDFDIADYYTSALIDDFAYYNASTFDYNDYLLISDWNATNESYYLVTNPANYWNDTHATFNKTYADTLYMDIGKDVWVNVSGDTMTGNLNLTTKNISAIDCINFDSGGKLCSGV